jgi:hypothetical protein
MQNSAVAGFLISGASRNSSRHRVPCSETHLHNSLVVLHCIKQDTSMAFLNTRLGLISLCTEAPVERLLEQMAMAKPAGSCQAELETPVQ